METRLPNSTHRAKLTAQVIGAVSLACLVPWVVSRVDTTGIFSRAEFLQIEGLATNLQLHRATGKNSSASFSFSIQGQENRFVSSAVNGIHPSWLDKPIVIRTYVPANKEQWQIQPYGVKTFGLWVDGVEQLSLENGVLQSKRGATIASFVALLCLGLSLSFGYAAYRSQAKSHDR